MYVKEISEEVVIKQEDMFSAYKKSYNFDVESVSMEYISAKRFLTHKQPNQIREALMKGYVEMSQLNLSICKECLQAEYEAEHMVERLVSGG